MNVSKSKGLCILFLIFFPLSWKETSTWFYWRYSVNKVQCKEASIYKDFKHLLMYYLAIQSFQMFVRHLLCAKVGLSFEDNRNKMSVKFQYSFIKREDDELTNK